MFPLCLQALCVNRLIKARDVFIDHIKKEKFARLVKRTRLENGRVQKP